MKCHNFSISKAECSFEVNLFFTYPNWQWMSNSHVKNKKFRSVSHKMSHSTPTAMHPQTICYHEHQISFNQRPRTHTIHPLHTTYKFKCKHTLQARPQPGAHTHLLKTCRLILLMLNGGVTYMCFPIDQHMIMCAMVTKSLMSEEFRDTQEHERSWKWPTIYVLPKHTHTHTQLSQLLLHLLLSN